MFIDTSNDNEKTIYVSAMKDGEHDKIYIFNLPWYGDNHFYHYTRNYNAFFHAGGKHYRNWTDKRMFHAYRQSEINVYMNYYPDMEVVRLDSIRHFFKEIGYDYKTKKYNSGEKPKPHPKG